MGRNSKPVLVLDLDGTLIDISSKYMYVFRKITGCDNSTSEAYWKLRKEGLSSQQILNEFFNDSYCIESFREEWKKLIEDRNVLSQDHLFFDSKTFLEETSCEFALILCTARRQEDALNSQLEDLKIADYFSEIIATRGVVSKASVLGQKISKNGEKTIGFVVGDTLEDIDCGHEIGFRTGAVLSGLTSRKAFLEHHHHPSVIADTLTELSNFLVQNSR